MVSDADLPPLSELLAMHRARLKKAVLVHMDPRLAARLDASDIVQDAFAEANRRWQSFLDQDAAEFYPWLRDIAMRRLTDLYRRHVVAERRSVRREEPQGPMLPDQSVLQLAERLVSPHSSPSNHLDRKERLIQVREALAALDPDDREVLVLKYLEELSTTEIASILGISDRAVRHRHRKALEKLTERLIGL